MHNTGKDDLKLDETDYRILTILEENGRTPNNEIAARLDLSEGTVRNRIRKLTGGNYLKIRGLTNVNMRTDKQLLFIMIKLTSTKHWERTAQKVSALPHVRSVSMITGRYDLVVEIYIERQRDRSTLGSSDNISARIKSVSSSLNSLMLRSL